MKTRYIYQMFRNTPKELVFAQTLFGFELASADPRIVAINFVGGEDDVIAMADYAEHMRMVGFLRALYPKVHVSLHAGELAPGLVPPEGLCCHIWLAVEQALPTALATAWTSCTRIGPTTCCEVDMPGFDAPSAACAAFLGASEKAAQQWELERRFKAFEASL